MGDSFVAARPGADTAQIPSAARKVRRDKTLSVRIKQAFAALVFFIAIIVPYKFSLRLCDFA